MFTWPFGPLESADVKSSARIRSSYFLVKTRSPFRLLLKALGHDPTYIWGPGSPYLPPWLGGMKRLDFTAWPTPLFLAPWS